MARARKELRGLLLPAMRRLHMTDQKDGYKRTILTTLRATGVEARVFSCRAKPAVARPVCLEAAVLDAVALRAERLVIENHSAARADRRLVSRVLKAQGWTDSLRYEHVDCFQDPLLWAADAVAWSVGAGGRWRELVDPLISHQRDLEPWTARSPVSPSSGEEPGSLPRASALGCLHSRRHLRRSQV